MQATYFFFILLIYSRFLYATDACYLSELKELSELTKIKNSISHLAADDEDIRNAPCLRKENISEEEMSDWLQANQSRSNINTHINGIDFENESFENIQAFRHLTTYVNVHGVLDPKKHMNQKSNCKKVECAIKDIFGKETGLQILYLQRKYGLNASHIVKDPKESIPWKKEDLDEILISLSDYPDGILPIEDSRPLTKAPKGALNRTDIVGGLNRSKANSQITIFDPWNEETREQRRVTLIHELGHIIADKTDLTTSPIFKNISKWTEATKFIKNSVIPVTIKRAEKPETIVSSYGQENNDEDFAESVVSYRYNPKHLKSVSPEKYDLIKFTVFDGVEYTSEEACRKPTRLSSKIKNKIDASITSWSPSAEDFKNIAKKCSKEVIDILANEHVVKSSNPLLISCFKNATKEYTSTLFHNELSNYPYSSHLQPMIKNSAANLTPEKINLYAKKSQEIHIEAIKNIFLDSFKTYASCVGSSFSIYDKFSEEEFGFNGYILSDKFEAISKKACERKKTMGPNVLVLSMFK